MANSRLSKINETLRKELSEIIRVEIKDPRVSEAMVSVTHVEATNDLKTAKVFISVLQNNKKQDVLDGLNVASGYIRKEIAKRINLRNTPEMIFKLDESIEYGMKMSKVIDEVMKESKQHQE